MPTEYFEAKPQRAVGLDEVLEMIENDALSEDYWWMENGERKYKNL